MAKVLIVDDDPFILDMYSLKFRENGFEVATETSGKKIISEIQRARPDIILLDIVMPSIDGFEILKQIKTDPAVKHIPIIMLTNLGQKEDIERGMKLGAADYIIKAHFTPSEIVEKIKDFLQHHK